MRSAFSRKLGSTQKNIIEEYGGSGTVYVHSADDHDIKYSESLFV